MDGGKVSHLSQTGIVCVTQTVHCSHSSCVVHSMRKSDWWPAFCVSLRSYPPLHSHPQIPISQSIKRAGQDDVQSAGQIRIWTGAAKLHMSYWSVDGWETGSHSVSPTQAERAGWEMAALQSSHFWVPATLHYCLIWRIKACFKRFSIHECHF